MDENPKGLALVEVYVRLYVPEKFMDRTPETIADIVDVVKRNYPGFKYSHMHSPVTVQVNQLNEYGGRVIEPEDYNE